MKQYNLKRYVGLKWRGRSFGEGFWGQLLKFK